MTLNSITYGEYIYLIQERESIRCGDNVYKIGMTVQEPNKRMKGYPKGSKLLLTIIVKDAKQSENDLKAIFRKKFVLRKEFGDEYFYGNHHDMIREIINYQQSEYMDIPDVSDKDVENDTRDVNDTGDVDISINEEESTFEPVEPLPPLRKPASSYPRKITPIVETKLPIQLAKYTKEIAKHVHDKQLVGYIHINYLKDNLFEVDSIDICNRNNIVVQQLQKDELEFEPNYDENLIYLNEYHSTKFKQIKLMNHKKYMIKIRSFKLRRYRGCEFLETDFYIDNV